jgi:hypothetical protein
MHRQVIGFSADLRASGKMPLHQYNAEAIAESHRHAMPEAIYDLQQETDWQDE